jgi:hypothetical protein
LPPTAIARFEFAAGAGICAASQAAITRGQPVGVEGLQQSAVHGPRTVDGGH